MGILKILQCKPVTRYEDIIGLEYEIPKGLRKLRLIWFLAGHPDERQRYNRDFEERMIRRVGKGFYRECLADPQGELYGLQKEARNLQKDVRKWLHDNNELRATLGILEGTAKEKEVF
jgi:hypothetical protein